MKYDNKKRGLKAERTKLNIYESGEFLFDTKGYSSVSVDSIVSHAKVSKGSFYEHFVSKGTLLAEIVIKKTASADEKYLSSINNLPECSTYYDKIIALTKTIGEVLVNDIGINRMKILYQVQLSEPLVAEVVSGHQRSLYKLLFEIISEAIEKNELKTDMSCESIVKYIMICYRGITYECCLRYPDFDYEKEVIIHIETALKGILS